MHIIDHKRTFLLIALYVFVGIIAGVGAIVFQQLLSLINIYVLQGAVGYTQISIVTGVRRFLLPWAQPHFRPWLLPVSAGLGGLITGLIVYRFAPEAAGHGTDEVIHSYHHEHGRIRLRVSMVKLVGSAITIGSGGSGGKEGPIAQIGAGFGSYICSRIPYYAEYRREIMLAGMAAGIAAIFRAPLAGAIFAAEILHSDMRYNGKVLIPAVIASTISYGVYALYFGFNPVILVPDFSYTLSLAHFGPFTVLALLSSFGAFVFVRVFYSTRDFFQALALKPYLKPAIGGLLTGLVALWFSPAFGEGSFHMQQMVNGNVPIQGMFLLFFLKMVTTSFSIGSGGSGGIFGPSLMIGAALGGTLGGVYLHLFPHSAIPLVVFVLLGMVGFFAGAANTPISTVIIITEMTHVYNLTVPFLWVAVFGYIFCQRWNIYENQATVKRHILDVVDPVESQRGLASLTVGEAMSTSFSTVGMNQSITEVEDLFRSAATDVLPVIDQDTGQLRGLIEYQSVIRHLTTGGDENALVREIATPSPENVQEDETLLEALRRFEHSELPLIPVTRADGSGVLTGLLRKETFRRTQPREWFSYLSPHRIVTDLVVQNREEAIARLCEIAESGTPGFRAEQITTAVLQREQLISTALDHGVAFPHAKLPGLKRPVVVVARSLRGLDWGARDGKRVRLIFLTLTPEENPSVQIQIARGIVEIVREEHVRSELLRAPKPAIMLNRIREAIATVAADDDEDERGEG
ncbi:MAG: CBS domain-containing protein [Spirochaetaceae bacterium]|nr:MAG: CBS domain-containing protein [Spirochaetaceae bacterium]